MLFTLFITALAALAWALVSSLSSASGRFQQHDPSTLELAAMAVITVTAFVWMKRLKAIREQALSQVHANAPQPIAERYAEAKAEIVAEAVEAKTLAGSESAA